jgi:polysaccharide export outer membrane protein
MKMNRLYLTGTVFVFVLSLAVNSHAQAPKNPPAKPAGSAPAKAADIGPQYIIGPEDVLYISVWKEEQISRSVPVRTDGKISLPLVDDVQAAGLTPMQLKEVLTDKFKKFIDNPTISVIVSEANSFKVYLSGEVKNPGVHRFRSDVTLVRLITQAGGFTEWANQKKILILRKEKGVDKRITVNYKKIIDGDEPDVTILSGDTVVVP